MACQIRLPEPRLMTYNQEVDLCHIILNLPLDILQ